MDGKERRESIVLESGGMKVFGVLHTPKEANRVPCVFFCHGLAGNKIGKDRIYVEIASRLSLEGIAAFRMDFRGSGDSEGVFFEMLPEYYVEDTLIALNFLSNRTDIDSSKIGIMARSFGGQVAVESASRWKKVKSLVLWCPMFSGSQWLDQWELRHNLEADALMRINGQQGSPAFFERFMQINVEKALKEIHTVPLLHIHGSKDTQVSLQHAKDYERIRSLTKAPSKFLRLPNTDHDFSNFNEKQLSIHETITWFKETL